MTELPPKTVIKTTTEDGRLVNQHSGLCRSCASALAQATVFWTDDAKFTDGDHTPEMRFTRIQKEATDYRAGCVRNCGRRTIEEEAW